MRTFRYTRDQRDNIGSGRVVVKGDEVKLSTQDERDPTNARLISRGYLVHVEDEAPTPPRRPRRQSPTPRQRSDR